MIIYFELLQYLDLIGEKQHIFKVVGRGAPKNIDSVFIGHGALGNKLSIHVRVPKILWKDKVFNFDFLIHESESGISVVDREMTLSMKCRSIEVNKEYLEKRVKYLTKAKSSTGLNSIFFMHHYNKDVRGWGSGIKPNKIEAKEILGSYDRKEYMLALAKIRELIISARSLGDSILHGPTGESISLMDKHPGFSSEIYEIALSAGMRDSR